MVQFMSAMLHCGNLSPTCLLLSLVECEVGASGRSVKVHIWQGPAGSVCGDDLTGELILGSTFDSDLLGDACSSFLCGLQDELRIAVHLAHRCAGCGGGDARGEHDCIQIDYPGPTIAPPARYDPDRITLGWWCPRWGRCACMWWRI